VGERCHSVGSKACGSSCGRSYAGICREADRLSSSWDLTCAAGWDTGQMMVMASWGCMQAVDIDARSSC
jgi:hypothetical protein